MTEKRLTYAQTMRLLPHRAACAVWADPHASAECTCEMSKHRADA
jgi:hypothetical protein